MAEHNVFTPIRITRRGESFQIRCGTRQGAVLYLYFDDDKGRAERQDRMNKADAEMLAKLVARTLRKGWGGL